MTNLNPAALVLLYEAATTALSLLEVNHEAWKIRADGPAFDKLRSSLTLAESPSPVGEVKAHEADHNLRPWRVNGNGDTPPEIVSDASPVPIVSWAGFDDSRRSMLGHYITANMIVSCVNTDYAALSAELAEVRGVLAEVVEAAKAEIDGHREFRSRVDSYELVYPKKCDTEAWDREYIGGAGSRATATDAALARAAIVKGAKS